MYLHIGKGTVIDDREIIGIFDLDITSQSYITRNYLSTADKSGRVINASEDIPRSFVVCGDRKKTNVYLSQIATGTLNKRNIK